MSESADIFISYSPADERWAVWLAWELEAAGYRTMLQAWDFVPGTNFIDFMDRGVAEADLVLCVLTRNYLKSRFGRLEWQAALLANPDNPENKLVTVRLEECRIDGLLSTITWVNLVGVTDPDQARALVLTRIQEALTGRAKPLVGPGSPFDSRPPAAEPRLPRPPEVAGHRRARRVPVVPPLFPSAIRPHSDRERLTVLQVAGPRFGRTLGADVPLDAEALQARIFADVTRLADEGLDRPELVVVTGNLTASGSRKEAAQARTFLTGLRALLGLEPGRLVIVPGAHDVTRAACEAYFKNAESDDEQPQPPYWPKWRHFATMFGDLYQGLDTVVFDSAQPWTLFPVPELRVVVAGLNSTMPISHLEDEQYGAVGEGQAAWFAERLRFFEQQGWLRIGAIHHSLLPGGADPLTDRAVVESLLGARLNAVLQDGVADEPAALAAGALCLGPELPSRHQLLEFTAAGVTVHRPGRPAVRVERDWRSAGATFPSAGPVQVAPVPAEPLGAVPAPRDDLLERVVEACETRFDRLTVRRLPGDPPSLRLTYREDGFVRELLVGVLAGTPTEQHVDRIARDLHASGLDQGAELVFLGASPPRRLREEAMTRRVRLRTLSEFQGLIDLSDYVADQSLRLSDNTTYPYELYVPQRFRDMDRIDQGVRDDVTGELLSLLRADQGGFVLLLGDFGRGKTFALREVVRRMATETPQLVPVLIELRALDKAYSVESLVAAHLAASGEEQIDLRAFQYMLRQGRIVLIFDGFDELVTRVTYDRAADHLETLLQAAQDHAKVVVASRTQHFKSTAQVFTALGEKVGRLQNRRVLSLEDFNQDQIRAYLVNRYGDQEKADARLGLLAKVEDLSGLARNPRMLSFIADLPDERLEAVAQARRTISPAVLYQEILTSWLRHEQVRLGTLPGAPAALEIGDLWQAVRTLALRLWESDEPYLRMTDVAEIAGTLSGLAEGRISEEQATHTVGAASLLIRTDDGLFGFIHESVAEWLVAHHVAREFAQSGQPSAALSRRVLSQLTVDFLCGLAPAENCRAWAGQVLGDPATTEVERANALKIISRLHTPAQTNLRGAQLQGEDLSERDLHEVDLSGADLTDTRLVRTNLSRAKLRGAKLRGAWLDQAKLTGADLRDADLSQARLARAELLDASIAGSRWTRATLINVNASARLLESEELRDAAVVPGRPVEVQRAPAAVGVPHGFHAALSRLPFPIAYSPDGQIFAAGNESGGILVCAANGGSPLRTLLGHRDRAYALAFGTADMLASGSADGTVRVWNTATGECRWVFDVHPEGVWPLVFSRDGGLLAAGAADGVIRIWDAATGRQVRTLPGHSSPIYTASFSPDGTELVTGDHSGTVRRWRDEQVTVLVEEARAVYRLVHSPDGTLLAAAEEQGRALIIDTGSGEVRHILGGHPGRVYAVDFHPGGRLVATGDTEGTAQLWNLDAPLRPIPLEGHTGAIYQVAFTPDGGSLLTADSNGSLRLWDAATGRRRFELSGHRGSIWPFAIRPDGEQLATTSNDNSIRLWDLTSGQQVRMLRGHGRKIYSVGFSPDGTMLATSGNDGVVRIWEAATGRCLKQLDGVGDQLTSAVFSPTGERIATTTNDGGVHLRQTGDWSHERELDIETDYVWAQAFSPDGDVLATANDDDTVRLWVRASGRLLHNLAGHRGRVRSIDFSPDGRLVATGCDDRRVRLWDTATGECTYTFEGHTDRVYRVMFDPSGDRLVSAGNDGTARVWHVPTRQPLLTLDQHVGRLWTVAFDPTGTMLATAGDDLAVRVWDAATGTLLSTLSGHAGRVVSVAFSPAEPVLASGGDDGAIILWRLDGAIESSRVTLLGLPGGWAAFTPDGRYKQQGDIHGEFWYSIGMCRFDPGELDQYLGAIRRLPDSQPFWP